MKLSASAVFVLLACVVCIHAYPWRPTHRPTPRPMKNSLNSNYNVNINTNKNHNDNAIYASLLSQLFGNQGSQYSCPAGSSWLSCYEKKVSLRSDAAAAAAVVEPTEEVVEKDAATPGDFDFNFDKFAQPQSDDDEEFEDSKDSVDVESA